MSWKEVKLGELYTAYNGLSKSKKFFGTGDPFLTFSTVFNNYFLPRKLTEYVQSTIQEQQNYSICRGDVFITRTSEKSDELGLSCVALKDYPKATYNGFTKRLRPINPDCVVPEYIGYYMRMPAFRQEFQAFSTMTTRASLRNDDLLGLTVLLPNIKTQERIAGILRHYDFLIENNQKQIKLLEEAAHRLYKEWFIDLRFPGHENVEIVDGIPVEWEYLEFLNIAPIITGKKDANFGSENGKYLFFTCSQQPLLAESYSYDCDAVILAGNGDFNVKLYRGKFEAYQRTYVLSPYKIEHLYLLFYTIKNHMNYLIQGASGSTIKFLTKGMIADIKVLVPTCEILNQYNEIAEPLQRKLEVLIYQNKLLTEARDRLLPKLMSGEIEV